MAYMKCLDGVDSESPVEVLASLGSVGLENNGSEQCVMAVIASTQRQTPVGKWWINLINSVDTTNWCTLVVPVDKGNLKEANLKVMVMSYELLAVAVDIGHSRWQDSYQQSLPFLIGPKADRDNDLHETRKQRRSQGESGG